LADQLRWILAGLSALLLAGIWWWGVRRSRQSPGNAELRESTAGIGAVSGHAAGPVDDEPSPRMHDGSRDWGVPPLEPLNVHTADFEPVEFEDLPMTAQTDPLETTFDLGVAERESAASRYVRVPTLRMNDVVPIAVEESPSEIAAQPESAAPAPAASPPAAPAPTASSAQGPNACETQRIVSVRVCAPGDMRWAGSDLMAALEKHGLAHGRYQVFHRRHSDGRTLFCAASLIEPGTFDIARMPEEEFRGLTLFAVLPGPAEPVQTLESLIATAAGLAETLHGVVQDSKGATLSQQRAEALREEVSRFQSQLTMN
jgi:cell division protein ZipA